MRTITLLIPCVAVTVAFSFSAERADAGAVIQFDSLEEMGTGSGSLSSYSEAGFDITSPSNSFAYWQTSRPEYAGSGALFQNQANGNTFLTKTGGGTFDLISIDLAESNTGLSLAANVSFIGNLSGGGTVTNSIDLDEVFGFETLSFFGFTNLVSVSWLQTANGHQFDNISLENFGSAAPVPEPASLVMWSIMGGIGIMVRRNRKKA